MEKVSSGKSKPEKHVQLFMENVKESKDNFILEKFLAHNMTSNKNTTLIGTTKDEISIKPPIPLPRTSKSSNQSRGSLISERTFSINSPTIISKDKDIETLSNCSNITYNIEKENKPETFNGENKVIIPIGDIVIHTSPDKNVIKVIGNNKKSHAHEKLLHVNKQISKVDDIEENLGVINLNTDNYCATNITNNSSDFLNKSLKEDMEKELKPMISKNNTNECKPMSFMNNATRHVPLHTIKDFTKSKLKSKLLNGKKNVLNTEMEIIIDKKKSESKINLLSENNDISESENNVISKSNQKDQNKVFKEEKHKLRTHHRIKIKENDVKPNVDKQKSSDSSDSDSHKRRKDRFKNSSKMSLKKVEKQKVIDSSDSEKTEKTSFKNYNKNYEKKKSISSNQKDKKQGNYLFNTNIEKNENNSSKVKNCLTEEVEKEKKSILKGYTLEDSESEGNFNSHKDSEYNESIRKLNITSAEKELKINRKQKQKSKQQRDSLEQQKVENHELKKLDGKMKMKNSKENYTEDTSIDNLSYQCEYNYENMLGVIIYKTDHLLLNSFIMHPVVKIHVVDCTTGEYVRRSGSSENGITEDFIGPKITKAFNLQERRYVYIFKNFLYKQCSPSISNTVFLFI